MRSANIEVARPGSSQSALDGLEKMSLMSRGPFISVVIPTYNRAQPTVAAIESVLAQTYPNFEIITVDDGSTDGSGDLIRRFIDETASRNGQVQKLHYLNQVNQGPSAARNGGIGKAQGEYIAFLDSDDIWFPEKLEWQVRALEQFKNCGACFTDAQMVSSSGMDTTSFKTFGKDYKEAMGIDPNPTKLIAKSFSGYWVSTFMARTDLIKQIGGFDPALPCKEDSDFCFRLSLVTSFAYVNKPLIRTDRSPSPEGSNCRPWEEAKVRIQGPQWMYEKWLNMDGALPPDVRRTILQSLRAVYSEWTNWYLENKQYAEARQSISMAAKYELTPGLTVKWILTNFAPALARIISPKSKPYE